MGGGFRVRGGVHDSYRCRAKVYPAAKNYPPPVTLPSVLFAVCIAQNWYLADSLLIKSNKDPYPKISIHKNEIKVPS